MKMGMQIQARCCQTNTPLLVQPSSLLSSPSAVAAPKLKSRLIRLPVLSSVLQSSPSSSTLGAKNFFSPLSLNAHGIRSRNTERRARNVGIVAAASSYSNAAGSPIWESWTPDKSSPSLSDVLWPSLGAFVAMAILGKIDQVLAPKGLSMTIAPLGAVCAVLFVTPSSPAARKYNMFMAQIGSAAIGVIALTLLGPGWLARSAALAASIAFMIYTRCTHPPAASLPLLFIDGARLHGLKHWYAFFPGAAGCLLLCFLQEIVCYLKDNYKF